jgi:hypothetical protein
MNCMPTENTYRFYQAYVKNSQDFLIAETELRRSINRLIKLNKRQSVEIQTKLYALLYSTFSEARFMKMILTPHGFEQVYVDEILKQGSVLEKWIKCIDLAFSKFNTNKKGSEIPNKKLEIIRIIHKYIIDPSIIRNKIAHGQLTIALNSKNSDLNFEITDKIENLDFVQISRLFEINKNLSDIVEELIESPDKAHYNNYYTRFQQLEAYIEKTQFWSLESKMKTPSMKKKVIYEKK